MSRDGGPAPLYADAFALGEWFLGRFGDDPRVLPRAMCECALSLLESITLALKNRRRETHIEMADECLIRLRTQLRVAREMGYLDEAQMFHALERIEAIGRQLGGWLRSLGAL